MQKYLAIAFLVLVSFTNCFSQSDNSLKLYIPFVANINDYSLANNRLSCPYQEFCKNRFGQENSAFSFSGQKEDYVKVYASEDFNLPTSASFSISLWFKYNTYFEKGTAYLFQKMNSRSLFARSDFELGITNNEELIFSSSQSYMSTNVIANLSKDWHHVVAIYENRECFIYLDNQLVVQNSSKSIAISQGNGDIYIGRNFAGIIDEVRFYNRSLNENEIADLYNQSNTASKLIKKRKL